MTPSHSALRRRVVRSRVIGVLAGLQLFTLPAHGQVESAPYLEPLDVWVDGSLDGFGERRVDYDAATSTFDIGEQLGAYSFEGATLFHSFLYFNLGRDQTAKLNAAPETGRILARVTGGHSTIAGTI